MTPLRRLAAAVAVSLLLAGCSDEPAGSGSDDPPGDSGDVTRVPGQVVTSESGAVSLDGTTFFASCLDDICVWDTGDGSLRETYDGGRLVARSPDGTLLATTATENNRPTVVLLDSGDGTPIRTLAGHAEREPVDDGAGGIGALAFGAGDVLASAAPDGTVRLWSTTDGTEIGVLETASSTPDRLSFTPDGRTLAVAAPDRPVELWDVEGQERIATLDAPAQETVVFSPDGATLATATSAADEDTTVTLWDSRTLEEPAPAHRTLAAVQAYALAYSPDGRTLAITQEDSTDVLLWPVAGGKPRRLTGLKQPPRTVLWSSDGKTLWSVNGSEGIVAWDPAAGRERQRFELPADPTSPDGP